jgi:ribosome modulation factor
MTDTLIEECPRGCSHSSEEHFAFDLGVEEGEQLGPDAECPYEERDLREAWLTGHSVGSLGREEG